MEKKQKLKFSEQKHLSIAHKQSSHGISVGVLVIEFEDLTENVPLALKFVIYLLKTQFIAQMRHLLPLVVDLAHFTSTFLQRYSSSIFYGNSRVCFQFECFFNYP